MPRVTVEGRSVYHVVGEQSQTVNICTSANLRGTYEVRYAVPISVDVDAAELAAQVSLDALKEWLAAHGGQPLGADGMPTLLQSDPDDPWFARARTAVERVLDTVVDAFQEQPYMHRVEHSLHAWIWSLLKDQPLLQEQVPLRDGTVTQLVHKEWPETIPRKKDDGTDRPRGLFDLAVLSPEQVRRADVEHFVFGRIEAPIVIEVGLDYGTPHLCGDHHKLLWSRVQAPYLLHLSRLVDKDQTETEAVLCDASQGVRTAYVHRHPRTGTFRSKHVHDLEVRSSEDPAPV